MTQTDRAVLSLTRGTMWVTSKTQSLTGLARISLIKAEDMRASTKRIRGTAGELSSLLTGLFSQETLKKACKVELEL